MIHLLLQSAFDSLLKSRAMWLASLLWLASSLCLLAAPPESTKPIAGLREKTPAVHALVGATIVVSPEKTIGQGTLVIRDGVIVAVGADVEVPADARRWDVSGKTLYPGFVDAYSEVPIDVKKTDSAKHWNDLITPQLRSADHLSWNEDQRKKLRSQGITSQLIAPEKGIIKGTSCLVATGDQPVERAMIAADVAQHVRLTISRRPRRETYPNSPMGAFALARQTFYDAKWNEQAEQTLQAQPGLARLELNDALLSLRPTIHGAGLVLINTANERALLSADAFAREFSLQAAFIGSGREYRRMDAVKRTGRTVILPLKFPKAPRVDTPESAMQATLESLLHWEFAPENPARLVAAEVPIAFTSHGLSDPKDFLKQLRIAVKRGLPKEQALRALTLTPAKLFGVQQRVGKLQAGLDANLIVADGDIFAGKTKVLETWVAGQRYEVTSQPSVDARGEWELQATDKLIGTLLIGGEPHKLVGELRATLPQQKETPDEKVQKQKNKKIASEVKLKLKGLALDGAHLTAMFDGAEIAQQGIARLSALVEIGSKSEAVMTGSIVWASGERSLFSARRTNVFDPESEQFETLESPEKKPAKDVAKEKAKSKDTERADRKFVVNFPLGTFGRTAPPEQSEFVLIKGATIWTCGPQGVISPGQILIGRGKVLAVGKEVKAPTGARVIDATGKHISPGIIDCHSHIATDGGVNESGQAITAEVRIGDFIDSDDIAIYRQLAGGVTSSNILHGSANPIGGQNQVLKFRWGSLPEEMKFKEAPGGIKFALGENVKQSNWGEKYTTRYPQTRMGVEQLMRDALTAAREYDLRWNQWNTNHSGLPPRRDLELEALAEVVRRERWIHCHSYRQDEILALLRTLNEFHITIGTFQHILEGYKVADEMAKHKAMGSAFSDWWAYKFEVIDAIPYNGALMHEQGVVVSFNSDDAELGRRLNLEAAKAIKYGGVPPAEALKFVTLNPAKQLRIDRYVGSLERGKHADLVIWSGDPLSTMTRCEQTWIDGRRYFDLAEDREAKRSAEEQHIALIQKILSSGAEMLGMDEQTGDDDNLWPRSDLFCHGHDHGHDHGDHHSGAEQGEKH